MFKRIINFVKRIQLYTKIEYSKEVQYTLAYGDRYKNAIRGM